MTDNTNFGTKIYMNGEFIHGVQNLKMEFPKDCFDYSWEIDVDKDRGKITRKQTIS